jgi:hypothetical protein
MTKQEHSTRINQRVRLKIDGQDRLYQSACAGAEGWVRKQDHDSLGYPRVFIEWDKDHWTFSGEPDRWALDAHFEPVGDNGMNDEEMFKRFQDFLASEGHAALPPSNDAAYQVALAEAFETAKGDDSFLLVSVKDQGTNKDGLPGYLPTITSYYKDANTGMILEAQLAQFVANGHNQLVAMQISDNLERRPK